MAIGGPQFIVLGVPVVGQFEHGLILFLAVTDKGQGEAAFRVILAAQQVHAEDVGIEGEGAVEVDDAQHGVQDTHDRSFQKSGMRGSCWRKAWRCCRQSGQSCSTIAQKRGLWFISLRWASSWQTM